MRSISLIVCLVSVPATLTGQVFSSGIYTVRQAEVEVARETYTFLDGKLTSVLELPIQRRRLESELALDARMLPLNYHATLVDVPGDSILQAVDVVFDSTSAMWTVWTRGADQSGATALIRPFSLMQNLVFSHLAIALMQYDQAAGGVQHINTWMPEGTGAVQLATEFRSATMGTVQAEGGLKMDVETALDGWLRKVVVAGQRLTVDWAAN